MILFMISVAICLAGMLSVNMMTEGPKRETLAGIFRFFILMAFVLEVTFSKLGYIPLNEKNFKLLFLWAILVLCLYFFVSDFVLYMKNKNDLDAAKKTIRAAVITLGGIIFFVAFAFYRMMQ